MSWRLLEHRFRRTTVATALCVSFLLGIGLARTGQLPGSSWWWLCAPVVVCTIRRRGWWLLIWMVLLGVTLGWWRGGIYAHELVKYQPYFDTKVTISAVALQDAVYNKYRQLAFDAGSVIITETGEHLKGKVSLSGFGLSAVFAGDRVLASGKLKPSLGSYQGRMSYAEVNLVEHHNTLVDEARRWFTTGVQSALPEPLAPFGMGLLIGQRNTLPPETSQALLMVGLTHIIAVSGYNLTILLHAAERLSGKRSRRLTTLGGLALIGLFLLFAGTSASIVRAAIVSLLSITAGYYGRRFKPLLLIMLAAVITSFANPAYVWSDTSWYLSFLAFWGVMILAPLVRVRLPVRWQESLLVGVALESVCAEIMTLPLILHIFGQMSFAGLVANVLVVTLVPLAMLWTLIAGLAGTLLPALAGWLAWPARWLLTYMIDTVTLLSRIPHVFVEGLGFSWLQMGFGYGLIIGVTAALHFKSKVKNVKITERSKEANHERTLQMVNY